MEHKIENLETQIALIKNDIQNLKEKKSELPDWLKNTAIAIMLAISGQVITTVWWASSVSTKLVSVQEDVNENTKFRMSYPKMHEEVMVTLAEIKTENKHIESMLKEVKGKLRFVDIKQQHKTIGE